MHEFTYITAFTVGLMGGVHCVGMCGGIVAALSFADNQGAGRSKTGLFFLLLGYNGGRLFSYTLIGALMGGFGWLLTDGSGVRFFQLGLQWLAAVFMLLMGLYISGWWMVLGRLEKTGSIMWRYIQPVAQTLLPVKGPGSAFVLGTLWGWLPCGLVYSVLVWSVSRASIYEGGLLMLCFGLGTLPNLMAMGLFASQLKRVVQHPWVRRAAGSLVIMFALFSAWSLLSS